MAQKRNNVYSNWAKSFGKSVKFGAKEILSEVAPSMADTVGSMAEEMRELRQDLRALRSNKRQVANYLLGEEENFSKYGSTIWKNMKSSARTGKFIDPKREDKAIMKAMGMDDLDLDMDFDEGGDGEDSFDMNNADAAFGDMDEGGSFGDVEMGPTKVVNVMGPSNRAIGELSEQINTTNKVVAGGFQRMAKANVHAFTISEALEKRFHSEKIAQFQSINSNLANIIQYNNETISTYVKASMEFYDKNLELLNSINEAMLRVSPVPETRDEEKKLESPVDAFMSGGFSIKGYSSVVAKNAKRMFSNSMVGGMLPMLNNDMMLSSIAANPLGFFLKEGISALLPERFTKSLEGLDKSYKNFIPAALTKLKRYNGDNPIVQFMSELFGIKTEIEDRDFKAGAYNKGPIPFDGETKAAITRVIPGYLSRQTAILETIASKMLKGDDTNLEDQIQKRIIVFNTDTNSKSQGTFMRRTEAIKMRKREEREKIVNSYSDSKWDLEEILSEMKDANGKVVDRNEDLADFIVGLTYADENWEPGNIDQIKRFMYMGAHGGKEPTNNDYLKDEALSAKADALKTAFSKMPNGSKLAMFGSERHEARINLSNFNRFFGSDEEHGVGAHEFAAVTSKGSIADLYTEKSRKKAITLSPKYRLIKNDKGKYELPADMLKLYNKENGKGGKYIQEFKNAKEVYEDMVVNHPEYLTVYDKDNKDFPPPATTPAQAAKEAKVKTTATPTVQPTAEEQAKVRESLLEKYKITQTAKGGWTMPSDLRKKYNEEHGTSFAKAAGVYKHIMETGTGQTKTTEATESVVGSPTTGETQTTKEAQSYKEILLDRYQLEQKDGKWSMPKSMIDKYNSDFETKFRSANTIYKDIAKRDKAAKKRKAAAESETDELSGQTTGTLTAKIKQIIEYPFNKMADLMDKANQVMHDIIFGKDGLGGNLKEMILGKYDEKSGTYSGGIFSGAVTSAKEMYKGAKEYLFGDGQKPGLLTNAVGQMKNIMEQYFGGKPEVGKDGKPITIIDKIKSTFVTGAGQLSAALFGHGKGAKNRQRSLEEARDMFNKAIPDMGKGAGLGAVVGTISGLGGFGLMGSLFLPGGPIGGAIVGAAAGFLKQSKGFREMIFGKEVKGKDGKINRVGGLFSQKMQNFMKAKKIPIIGGATMGVISTAMGHGIAFGLMPSIVVGAFGPVVAGAAWGLLSHSRSFRNLIFGKDVKGSDGVVRRVGGLLNNKLMRGFKTRLPRALAGAVAGIGSMGVISQLGIVGNMVALGPIPAAIAGAGLGIASASKNFTKMMFGYTDKSGKYHSGAMDKVKNFFTVEIFEPLKLKISKELFEARFWVRKNVIGTLRKSFAPFREAAVEVAATIKKEFSEAMKPIKDGFTNIFTEIGKTLKSVFEPVVTVVRQMSDFMFEKFKRAVQLSITTALLPLRAAGGLIKMILKGRDYKSSVTDALGGVGAALRSGSGLLGAMGNLGGAIFNPKLGRFEAEEKNEKFIKRIEEKAYKKGSMFYQAKAAQLKEMQRKAREGGYALSDEQVNAMRAAENDAKIMDAANASKDQMTQMQRIRIDQGAETNVHLAAIEKAVVSANEAEGVAADDDPTKVDKMNRERKEVAEKEKKQEEREAKRDGMWRRMLDFFTKKKEKGGWFWKIMGTVGSIASGILGVISSIGGIGGTLLGIYGILKMAFGDKTEGGASQRIAHSDAMGNLVERGVKGITYGVNKNWDLIKSAGRAIGGAGKTIAGKIGKTIGNIEEVRLIKTMGQNFAEGTGLSKLYTGLKDTIIKSIESIRKSTLAQKLFGEVVENGAKGKPGLLRKFVDLLKSLADLVSDKRIMDILKKKFPSRFAAAAAKTGTAATGYGLAITAGFAVYDGVTGMVNADRLFDVNPEDVTITMRIVSSFINTLFGLPGMVFIDLALTGASIGAVALSTTAFGKVAAAMGIDFADMDHRKAFAQFILSFIQGDEANAKTKAAQNKFDNEYKEYLKEKGLQPGELSKEQYREKMGNKTLWQRLGAPILDKLMGIEGSDKTPSFRQRVNDEFERLVKWFKDSVKAILEFHPIDYIQNKLNEFFKPIGDRLKNISTRWNELTSAPLLTDEGKAKSASAWSKFKNGVAGLFSNRHKDDDFEGTGPGFNFMGDARYKDKFGKDKCAQMTLANILGVTPEVASKLGLPSDLTQTGTKASYFKHAAGQLGLSYKENLSPKDMIASLMSGAKTVVGGSSTNPNSPFYGNGHYIMAKGINPDGTVNIVNPTSRDKKGSIDIRQLMKESGFSGSFVGGAPGRMTLDEAYRQTDTSVDNQIKYDDQNVGDGYDILNTDPQKSESIKTKLLNAAKSFLHRGIYYSQNPGRLDPDSSGYTDCSGYVSAIYKKAFGKDLLTPYAGEFDNPNMAGQWNESTRIPESEARIGDLVFWETEPGVIDNHVGMVTDPERHLAVASNTSTGPIEFQWDNSYWGPMFTCIRRPDIFKDRNMFIGAGRMTLASSGASRPTMYDERGKMPTKADLDRLEEMQANSVMDEEGNVRLKRDKSDAEMADEITEGVTATSTADFKRMQETEEYKKKTAEAVAKSEAKAKTMTPVTTENTTDSNKLSLTELLTGIGLGMKNLFSSVWGGSKYEFVTINDIKNGLKSLFGGGGKMLSGAIQKRLLEAARSFLNRGIRYSQSNPGRLDPDTSGYTDCSGYTAAIYKKAFGKNVLTPYGGEFDDPDRPGQWNESEPIKESDAQIGDLVFWETAKGVPDNHVGMVTDPSKHMAVASNTSTGPAEFQWDSAYWKPMFTGIRRPKALAALAGSEGSTADVSEGKIETKKAVWDYLVNNMGINRAGAAGIMGNIQQESKFNTGAIGDNGTSGGLVQWHDESPGVGRFTNLKDYASSVGKPWDNVDTQMGFLNKELNNSQYKSKVYDQVINAVSPQDAVDTWVRHFEIPADIEGEIYKRTQMARTYYNDTENFVGGANNFMANNSGLIGGLLTGWANRYAERGRMKRARQLGLEQAARQYASQQTTGRTITTTATSIPASAKVLPAKVDTSGATMDDILLSIRALDSHSELNQIINYLAAIANNGGIGGNRQVTRTDADRQNMQRYLDRTKLGAREEAARMRLGPERYKDLINSMDAMGNLSRDQIDIAIDIAKGGNFRNS